MHYKLVMLEPHLSWQAQHLVMLQGHFPRYVFGVGTSGFVAGAALVILECHFSWQSVTRFGDFAM